jgi:cytochrome P450 family 628
LRIKEKREQKKKEKTQNTNLRANLSGRFSCVGKQLGLMEVRRVTALIARKYNVAMASGQTKEAFLAGLRDNFTLATPALNLVFSSRS